MGKPMHSDRDWAEMKGRLHALGEERRVYKALADALVERDTMHAERRLYASQAAHLANAVAAMKRDRERLIQKLRNAGSQSQELKRFNSELRRILVNNGLEALIPMAPPATDPKREVTDAERETVERELKGGGPAS